MSRRLTVCVASAGFALSSTAAQPPEAKPTVVKPSAPVNPAVPLEFDIGFADGSNVKAAFLEQSVGITTRYGKLVVPLAELKRVELGFRYQDGVEAKVTAAVERLAAPNYQDREAAGKELVELKDHAVPLLTRAGADPVLERNQRARALLRVIRPTLPEDRVNAKDYDTVETAEFTVRGRLDAATLKVRTRQFGEATVRLAEVRQFRAAAAIARAREVTLDAAAHAKLNWSGWLDTGVEVAADGPLEITAAGRIDQWPQEPGKYTSGPAGNGAPAQNVPGNFRPQGDGQRAGPDGLPVGTIRSGAVVGRVGDAGTPFLVGDTFKQAKAGGTGRLYLLIAPSHWGNDNCTGEYRVKVRAGD